MARKSTAKPAIKPAETPPVQALNALDSLTDEQATAMYRMMCAEIARQEDSPEGFGRFFWLITGMELTDHAQKWVEAIYRARKDQKYAGDEAFRGSAKTTVFTTFVAFRIGHEPTRHNLVIQVGDDIARDNSERIADIIANNPGWKEVFPNIVPDVDKGWGSGGYEVKRTDISYEQWRNLNAARKDPTFVGLGYESRAIIGKRPDGVLLVDDILDENNTSSDREMAKVEKILTGTIFPTMTKDTWLIFVFTPWRENDPVVKVTSGESFELVKTPVYEVVTEGTPGAVDFEGEWIKLTWPQRFGVEELRRQKGISGSIEFARMYLLDLTKAANSVFKYISFPSSESTAKWPVIGGIDYAGTMDIKKNATGKNDYFAMAYVVKHPEGGAIVIDGVFARCTQSEAENYAMRAQEIFPFWQYAVVEGDGKGEEFIQVMMRHPSFRLIPMKTGGKGKQERLVRQMGPWLESGRVRISDASTPFLNELRRELDQYPFCDRDDCLDAIYWAFRGIPDVLTMPKEQSELPSVQRRRNPNPFCAFGRRS